MLFEAMKSGRINKDTRIPISAYAAARPPTKIGFKPGQSIRVEDAILAMVTKSANDVATASGEFLGGSEERFAQMMTTKARRLGMSNTTFRNASGLPNMSQQTTARDMAILSIALRQHFPRNSRISHAAISYSVDRRSTVTTVCSVALKALTASRPATPMHPATTLPLPLISMAAVW